MSAQAEDDGPAESKKEIVARCSSELMRRMQAVLRENPLSDEARSHCFCHDANCLVNDKADLGPGVTTLVTAGSTCVDDSPFGSRRGMSGRAAKAFLSWVYEMRSQGPDLILHECSHLFDVGLLHDLLGDLYHVMQVKISPKDLGFPMTRMRSITWLVSRSTMMLHQTFDCNLLSSFEARRRPWSLTFVLLSVS